MASPSEPQRPIGMNGATVHLARASSLRPEQLVRDYLRANPAASPADVVLWLRAFGIEMPTEVAESLLIAMKTG